MEIKEIFDRLYDYYNVYTIQDLATSMNVSQSTVSQWKSRNSISAIEKKCRELGIYNKIFDNSTSNIQKIKNQKGNNSFYSSGSNNVNADSVETIQELNFSNPEIMKILKAINSISQNDEEKEKSLLLHLKTWLMSNL